jgi:hypothetical protein
MNIPVTNEKYSQLSTEYELNALTHWGIKNSIALVRERLPLVGEVSDNSSGWRVSRGQRNGSPWHYSRFSRPEGGCNS